MKTMTKTILTLILLLSLPAAALPSGASGESGIPHFSAEDQFTERDLVQEADLTGAVRYTAADGEDIHLTAAGTYVLTGKASNVTVWVEAAREDKVQIVLDGAEITNDSFPVLYAKTADKVFVTALADSTLTVTGSFTADGGTKTDGTVFSKCDLVLNGNAQVTVSSPKNGVVGKDDLKVTGGTWNVSAASKAVEANDSIRIAGGTLNLTAGTDGLHAENEEDSALGYVYISGGTLRIQAGDDGIHASSAVQIDGGTLSIQGAEGIEGSFIQINGGSISVEATDDGINATRKSAGDTSTASAS